MRGIDFLLSLGSVEHAEGEWRIRHRADRRADEDVPVVVLSHWMGPELIAGGASVDEVPPSASRRSDSYDDRLAETGTVIRGVRVDGVDAVEARGAVGARVRAVLHRFWREAAPWADE